MKKQNENEELKFDEESYVENLKELSELDGFFLAGNEEEEATDDEEQFDKIKEIKDTDLSDEIFEDEASLKAKDLVRAFVNSLIKKRVNQYISALDVNLTHENIDFANKEEVDNYIKRAKDFNGAVNLYNMPDLLRMLPLFLFKDGQAAFLVRPDIKTGEIGVSLTSNFMYRYDNYNKLTYVMLTYQSKQGIESKTIVETYDIKNNVMIFDTIEDGISHPSIYPLNEFGGTEESPIPVVLIFNAWQAAYSSDLSQIQSQLIQLQEIYTKYFRNLENSGAYSFDVITGEAQAIEERVNDQKNKNITGQATSSPAFFIDDGKQQANNNYIPSSMTPTIEAFNLAKGIEIQLDEFLNFKSFDLAQKGAQQNQESIQYSDSLNIQALQNFADYIKTKTKQVYNLLLGQINFFDEKIDSVEVKIKDSFIFKNAQDRQFAAQEYTMGLTTIKDYIMEFGRGSLIDKMLLINELVNKEEERIDREQELKITREQELRSADNKSLEDNSSINSKSKNEDN